MNPQKSKSQIPCALLIPDSKSLSITSPLLKKIQKPPKPQRPLASIHCKSSSFLFKDKFIKKIFNRTSTFTGDNLKIDECKSKSFEALLEERLEVFNNGNSKWTTEVQVLDSVYIEITEYLQKFSRILKVLRNKYEESFIKVAGKAYAEDLEKTKKNCDVLVKKINSLSKINQDLQSENEELKRYKFEYERLFETSPNVLISYSNIVEKMLEQCKVIENLNHEVRALRKSQLVSAEIISSLKLQIKNKEEYYKDQISF